MFAPGGTFAEFFCKESATAKSVKFGQKNFGYYSSFSFQANKLAKAAKGGVCFCFLFASVAKTIWQLVMVCCSLVLNYLETQHNLIMKIYDRQF